MFFFLIVITFIIYSFKFSFLYIYIFVFCSQIITLFIKISVNNFLTQCKIYRTLDYVYKELLKIPENIPVLVLGNHCDMNHHRSVNGDEVIYYLKTLERCLNLYL